MLNRNVFNATLSVCLSLCEIHFTLNGYVKQHSVVAEGASVQSLTCCNFWLFNACLVRQKGHGRSAERETWSQIKTA